MITGVVGLIVNGKRVTRRAYYSKEHRQMIIAYWDRITDEDATIEIIIKPRDERFIWPRASGTDEEGEED